jgi:hypothetical protein
MAEIHDEEEMRKSENTKITTIYPDNVDMCVSSLSHFRSGS